jgi:hypothetical protein
MKLMFLIEHYNPESKELTKKGLLHNDFIIYFFGVFSRDVMNDYLRLYNMKVLDEVGTRPTLLKHENSLDLDDETKSRVDLIISEFGNYEGSLLVHYTLKRLGLTKETKDDHFEESVIPLIPDTHKRSRLASS